MGRDVERLKTKFTIDKASGCWLWFGGMYTNGYGQFWLNGRKTGAHRAAYLLLKGSIPRGLDLDHLCRVRHCVNPDHLEPVTRQENLLRGEGLAAIHASQTRCPQGHPYDSKIYSNGYQTRRCRLCVNAANRRAYHKRKAALFGR